MRAFWWLWHKFLALDAARNMVCCINVVLLLNSPTYETALEIIIRCYYCCYVEPMPEFDRESFLGKWYEIERYFTVSDIASRCITVEYERRSDGKVWVNNEITNRMWVFSVLFIFVFLCQFSYKNMSQTIHSTNVQRIVSGVMQLTSKDGEGKFVIKYQSLPVNYDTTMHVLDTDYDSYAVLWSCNSIAGPVGNTRE